MENIKGIRLLDLDDGNLGFIIEITKENMTSQIKRCWGLDWDKDFEERYKKEMRSSGVVKVVYSSDEPIGYFWFCEQADKSQMFINSIQIREDYQEKGLGLCILRWIENNAINRKIQYLCLAVQETNQRAINIYHKYGFREVSKENQSIRLQKELNPGATRS